MWKLPKYTFTLIATMCVIGMAQTYYVRMDEVAFEAAALGQVPFATNLQWLCDCIARLGVGLLAFLLYDKLNGYFFMLFYAILAFLGAIFLFLVIVAQVDGGFFAIAPAALWGLALGGYWVSVPQVLIDDAGPKHYGLVYGYALLFMLFGIFGLELLIYFIEWGTGAAVTFLILAILALVMTILAWMNDKSEKK